MIYRQLPLLCGTLLLVGCGPGLSPPDLPSVGDTKSPKPVLTLKSTIAGTTNTVGRNMLMRGGRIFFNAEDVNVPSGLMYIFSSDISDLANPTPLTKFGSGASDWVGPIEFFNNSIIYLGWTDRLSVFDITDPAAVTFVQTSGPGLVGDALAMRISGNYLFAVEWGDLGGGSFHSVDITDPTNPVAMGTVPLADNTCHEVEIIGNTAYVKAGTPANKIYSIDITAPAAPALLSTLSMPTGESCPTTVDTPDSASFVAHGTNLYSINMVSNTLHVIDASTQPPSLISNVGLGTAPGVIHFVNGYMAVASYKQTPELLQIYDVSDPTSPVLLDSHEIAPQPAAIAVDGTTIAVLSDVSAGTVQLFTFKAP